jgi:hypothetical protein
MDRIEDKSIGVLLPALAEEFIRSKASESLESLGKVISGQEVSEMCTKLGVSIVMEAVNGGLLARDNLARAIPCRFPAIELISIHKYRFLCRLCVAKLLYLCLWAVSTPTTHPNFSITYRLLQSAYNPFPRASAATFPLA